jgi:hypothetical protein
MNEHESLVNPFPYQTKKKGCGQNQEKPRIKPVNSKYHHIDTEK